MKELTDAIHQAGGKAGIQLWQGSLAVGLDQTAQILMASDMPMGPDITLPGISIEQIHEVVECYGKAAARAVKAGFDCIEFHYVHNYLPHSFLSGGINHRTDDFDNPKVHADVSKAQKVVFVTGASGIMGQETIKQLLARSNRFKVLICSSIR